MQCGARGGGCPYFIPVSRGDPTTGPCMQVCTCFRQCTTCVRGSAFFFFVFSLLYPFSSTLLHLPPSSLRAALLAWSCGVVAAARSALRLAFLGTAGHEA